MMVGVSKHVWPCFQSLMRSQLPLQRMLIVRIRMFMSKVLSPILWWQIAAWLCAKWGDAKPSPQFDTKCHHMKFEAILLHPKFHKTHRSSKPTQDIGDGRMTSCPNFPKLRSWSTSVFNLIIIYYHLTLLGENEDTQNISIRISNCSYTGSNNFPCWKRN